MVSDMFPNRFKIIGCDRLSEGKIGSSRLESRAYPRGTILDEMTNEPNVKQKVNKPTRETRENADRPAVINTTQRSLYNNVSEYKVEIKCVTYLMQAKLLIPVETLELADTVYLRENPETQKHHRT